MLPEGEQTNQADRLPGDEQFVADADLDWYESHLSELQPDRGEWVAIARLRPVAFAARLDELFTMLGTLSVHDPLIVEVVSDDPAYLIA
jgi:hypothetical protein